MVFKVFLYARNLRDRYIKNQAQSMEAIFTCKLNKKPGYNSSLLINNSAVTQEGNCQKCSRVLIYTNFKATAVFKFRRVKPRSTNKRDIMILPVDSLAR